MAKERQTMFVAGVGYGPRYTARMKPIKKLDSYILQKFLPLFAGAFFICLFIFMMQFTWRYLDELIGKGLTVDVLAEFFWHMGITLIPTSLPLAVLLASLITFGNMGEDLELLAMKAAGVPLIRIMRPVLVLVIILTGVSFYFQNVTAPHAQISLRTLLISMKQAQPAVEIPEGVFYNDIPNYNLFVERKNAETGMLYNVIIYKTDQGFDRAQIVVADSGRMEMSSDKLHLRLNLWNGELFENLQQENFAALNPRSVPYDRETFFSKDLIIDFDSNFALMDKNMLRDMPTAKSMKEISLSIDSMNLELDSMGMRLYADTRTRFYECPQLPRSDSLRLKKAGFLPFDTLLARTPADMMSTARKEALGTMRRAVTELEWKSVPAEQTAATIRRHEVEWHRKMSLSLSCLFFFFVGAPLGAIIRKGGLGMPAVISVIIFIFYYIIDTSGMKMARDGSWNMIYGMWVSSVVLIPFGAFLTYKANKDSVLFNAEMYTKIFYRLFGLRTKRRVDMKEVVIENPDYEALLPAIRALGEECRQYAATARLKFAPRYSRLFFRSREDHCAEHISGEMERIVAELSNSRKHKVIAWLNEFPVIYAKAHVAPFTGHRRNVLAGLFFPFGIILWFRCWRFRLRLLRDLKQTVRTCAGLARAVENESNAYMPGEGDNAGEENRKPSRRYIVRGLFILILAIIGLMAGVGLQRCQRHSPQSPQPKTVVPSETLPEENRNIRPSERRNMSVDGSPMPARSRQVLEETPKKFLPQTDERLKME